MEDLKVKNNLASPNKTRNLIIHYRSLIEFLSSNKITSYRNSKQDKMFTLKIVFASKDVIGHVVEHIC